MGLNLHCAQKEFVVHAHSLKTLEATWSHQNERKWVSEELSLARKAFVFVAHLVLLPVTGLVQIISPAPKTQRKKRRERRQQPPQQQQDPLQLQQQSEQQQHQLLKQQQQQQQQHQQLSNGSQSQGGDVEEVEQSRKEVHQR